MGGGGEGEGETPSHGGMGFTAYYSGEKVCI